MGHRLREARGRARLTQAELAARSGVSQAVISMAERGERRPSPPVVEKLARALGVSAQSLYE